MTVDEVNLGYQYNLAFAICKIETIDGRTSPLNFKLVATHRKTQTKLLSVTGHRRVCRVNRKLYEPLSGPTWVPTTLGPSRSVGLFCTIRYQVAIDVVTVCELAG